MANMLRHCALSKRNIVNVECRPAFITGPTSSTVTVDISNRFLAATAKKCITICCFVKYLS